MKLPLRDFYAEYSRLWQHSLDVRYKYRGKLKTYMQLGAAVATGKVSFKDVKIGMNVKLKFIQTEGDGPAMPFFAPA